MGNFYSDASKSISDAIYDALFHKADKYDNTLFPPSNLQNPFTFKYDGSELFWCEWWTLYMYGKSESNFGISGMINYIFVKGLNDIGVCIIYIALLINGVRKVSWDIINLDQFKSENTSINISLNTIVQNDDSYLFNGNSNNENIKWNLNLEKKHDSIYVAQKIKLGIDCFINLPTIENASFASIIPFGNVTGNLIIDGITYDINQYGEMDHIWGPVLLSTISWNLLFGGDDNNNVLYYLHAPSVSNMEEKGCLYLCLDNNKYIIRDYETTEYKTDKEYPDKIIIKGIYQNIIIEYNILSLSASNNGSASENHVKINIKFNDKEYLLFGMAEYYKSSLNFFNKDFIKELKSIQ